MEENTTINVVEVIENKIENPKQNNNANNNDNIKMIAGSIILAGVIIAGAILLKGSNVPTANNPFSNITLKKVDASDRTIGNTNAKVTLIMYEDFQCPWCGKFDTESEQAIRNTYVKDGKVQIVFRDFPFLGEFTKPYVLEKDESINTAMAARCALDQGKFWEYHDYLFSHQNGENQGNFSVVHLKSFATNLNLNTLIFNQCLDSRKYAQAVTDSKTEGSTAGVQGTPKGFILKNGKIVDTIDGYLPLAAVNQKIESALK